MLPEGRTRRRERSRGMEQKTFEFMTQGDSVEASGVVLDEETIEALVSLMARTLAAVVAAAAEVSDAG